MASGQQHDRATWILALPFGLLWGPWLGLGGVMVGGLAFLIGGLWLSPDLDTRSNPSHRWGPLRLLWWPYRRLLRHRSLLSHSPFLGSTVRLLYLAALITGVSWAAASLGCTKPAAAGAQPSTVLAAATRFKPGRADRRRSQRLAASDPRRRSLAAPAEAVATQTPPPPQTPLKKSHAAMACLDFDGDYGRTYNDRIRRLIPAYDAIFELAAATAKALRPQARRVLL